MVETFVRTVAIVTSLLVLVSFGLFARDQFAGASQRQSDEVVGIDHSLPNPHREAQPRRFVDAAARALTRPFTFGDTSRSAWGQRAIPTLIALLIYGFGLGFLARSLRWLRRRPTKRPVMETYVGSSPPPRPPRSG